MKNSGFQLAGKPRRPKSAETVAAEGYSKTVAEEAAKVGAGSARAGDEWAAMIAPIAELADAG